MQIHFHGATRTVTGTLHEIRAGGQGGSGDKCILLDCGLFQGPRAVARQINCCFDFDPKKVDAVILTHAHADHCGNLPNLVKEGYAGPIYCTKATAAIAALMLIDSANIQEEDAAHLNKKPDKNWQGQIVPLYTREDAEKTITLFKPLEYRMPLDLGGVRAVLHDAGHILGSAAVSLTETRSGRILVFSGDLGRPNSPILENADPFTTPPHAFISECTYGGKTHAPLAQVPGQIAHVVNETVNRGGILMIPAFALGRTQAMLQELNELQSQKKIPATLPIFVDSPLATRLTEVYRRFPNLFDEQTRHMTDPIDFPNLTYIRSTDESRALNTRKGPFIVISASGMCEAGRILHHLKHHIADSKNTVLLPGFQAENTLGRRIQDRVNMVPILGDTIPLRCHVEQLDGLSAHADGKELLAYTQPLKPNKIYLVHGEVPQAQAHQRALMAAGFSQVSIATRGDVVEV
jgi:metallo-beta-lactamase family protein